jgi:hypothetical protein
MRIITFPILIYGYQVVNVNTTTSSHYIQDFLSPLQKSLTLSMSPPITRANTTSPIRVF